MDSTTLVAVVALGLAGLTQALKDNLKVDPVKLRFAVPVLAGVLALVISLVDGDAELTKTLINVVVGAFVPAGAHGVLLQGNPVLGRVLKAVGAAIIGPGEPK